MKKIVQFVVFILILVVGFFVYQYLLPQIRAPQAFLKIETTPSAEVFLNGDSIGSTPLQEKNLKVGGYNLVIKAKVPTMPQNPEDSGSTKEVELAQKIDLYPSAVTSVKYEFAPNDAFSSGEVLGLRQEGAGISVVTNPENAEVSLDSKSLGNSPLSQVVNPGVHTLKVSKEGYLTREIGINIQDRFRLTAWVSLALDPYPKTKKLSTEGKFTLLDLSTNNLTLSGDFQVWAEAIWHLQNTQKDVPKKFDLLIDQGGKTYTLNKSYDKKKEVNVGYLSGTAGKLSDKAQDSWEKLTKGTSSKKASAKVTILDTPNGFLNVRSGPGTNFSIIQKINPGDSYDLLEEKGDWYKIILDSSKYGLPDGKAGWIFSQFTKKL